MCSTRRNAAGGSRPSDFRLPTSDFSLSSLLPAPLDDHGVSALVAARLVAAGGLAPRAARARLAHRLAAFAAAVRVVARAHGRAAHSGPNTQVALAAGLAQLHVRVVQVAHL